MNIDLHHQDETEESNDPVIWSRYQLDQRASAIAADAGFVAAMNLSIKKGREKVKPGTYVDLTPPVGALRLRGSVAISGCGSPAAMCMEAGGAHSGAEAMK